jgi:hypothetical protein
VRATTLRNALLASSLAAASLLIGGVPSARAGDPPKGAPAPAANPLRGTDVKALLDKAAEMKAKDVRALGQALTALGDPVPQRAAELEFLVEYGIRESSRPLRLLAFESAQRVDPAGAAAAFAKKAAEKDAVRAALALEALAVVGTKEQVPAVLDLMKSPSEMVAVAAADAMARIGTTKELDQIIDLGLTHPEAHVSDHAAWAAQDILKVQKTALERFQKIAGKKSDPRSIRADATAALLADKSADPHKWTSPFEAARKALLAAPASPPVNGKGDNAASVQKMVDWLKEKLPAEHWLLCAAVTKLNVPGPKDETAPDFDDSSIGVKLSDSILPPNKLAYIVYRQAVVLFRKKIGEPFKSHRGWEPAIFDSYDLCVAGRMYDAGPGGLTRERFLSQILSTRPWGGL